MKRLIFCSIAVLLFSCSLFAQNTLTVSVVDSASSAPIVGANVFLSGTTLGGAADVNGKVAISEIPNGSQTIIASAVGYKTFKTNLTFPLPKNFNTLQIKLMQTNVELEGVTVTTTRTSYHLNDSPERVEVRGP
ncbi:MAG: carboxypeptidase-like regulatory domain-containing protein, partial [Bacteroidota bacterium]|nr:carboxypeptidase-like regulatory domain-containing protein [Bacteroidota bacterium]